MKVLANDGISEGGKKAFQNAGIELIEHRVAQEHLANFINEHQIEVLLVRSATKVTKDLIDACPTIKIIGRGGVGLDNIEVKYAESKGITVINTPMASSRSVAEMVFAHFLSLARFLHETNRTMPLEGDTKFNQLKKNYANGVELQGKTLGVIGFGNIGKEIVKIGVSIGMKVKVLTKNPVPESIRINFFDGQAIDFTITPTEDLEEFLPEIDFLTINTPKTEGYIIDTPQFKLMKDGVFIVNTARGGVINEVSLLEAIEDGKVAGAALDVFENEPHPELNILMNPALSLSPHLAGSTIDAQDKIGIELAEKIIKLTQ